MHESLQIIRQEHRRLAAVLQCLNDILTDVATGRVDVDFGLYRAAIDYMENYLFRFHHPKEDQYLFPLLRERYVPATDLTRELERQHERGDVLLDGLRSSLEMYQRHNDAACRGEFESALRAYHQYEREHMGREERELLPLALEHLLEDDWSIIDQAFQDNLDPLFGDHTRHEFRALFSEIANRAPAPHGLG